MANVKDDEVGLPEDSEGETKVDKMGRLQGDREPEGETVKIYERWLTVPHSAAPSIARITDLALRQNHISLLAARITDHALRENHPSPLAARITDLALRHNHSDLLATRITEPTLRENHTSLLAACLTDPALRQNHSGHLAARVMIRSLSLKSSGTKVDKRGRFQDGRSSLTLHSSASRQGREQGERRDDKSELPEDP